MAPFGPMNMKPTFTSTCVRDNGYGKQVGADKTHLKLTVFQGENQKTYNAIGFNLGAKIALVNDVKLGIKVRKAATLQGALGKTVNNRAARRNDGNWIASICGADCAQRLRGFTLAGDICLGAQFAVRYAVKWFPDGFLKVSIPKFVGISKFLRSFLKYCVSSWLASRSTASWNSAAWVACAFDRAPAEIAYYKNS